MVIKEKHTKTMIATTSPDYMLGYQVQADYWIFVVFFAIAMVLFWKIFAGQIKSILYPRP
jgi:hypothetical protein